MNSWTMHAQVADSFTNSHENVFLAGDAAHRFPPAGLYFSFYPSIFSIKIYLKRVATGKSVSLFFYRKAASE